MKVEKKFELQGIVFQREKAVESSTIPDRPLGCVNRGLHFELYYNKD